MNFEQLSPEDFTTPPFRQCPYCSCNEYGVWKVEGRTYERRCRQCVYIEGYTLPLITKRLIYLDQFALASILHAYRPETQRNTNRKMDPFWKDVAERIFRLGAWQLVSCPATIIHQRESILDDRLFRHLQRLYNYLEFGVGVHFPGRINGIQIGKGFRNYLAGSDEQVTTEASDIAWALHDWQSQSVILPRIPDSPDVASNFRDSKNVVSQKINSLFGDWGKALSVSFEERCRKESSAPGQLQGQWIYQFLVDYPLAHAYIIATGCLPAGIPQETLGFESRRVIAEALDGARDAGLPPAEGLARLAEFLQSDACRNLPANRLSGLLYARLAHDAKHTPKRVLSKGMANDVFAVSVYLPYMDAMFLDNECRGLLADRMVASRLSFNTKLYSLSKKVDFLAYLDGIEASASPEHLPSARELYGDEYMTPEEFFSSESRAIGLPPGLISEDEQDKCT